MSTISSAVPGTDNNSGFFFVPDFQIAVIARYKQMVVLGDLDVEGALQIEGQLILEP